MSYESVGTVSYKVTANSTVNSGAEIRVVFTPDSDHCVMHENQRSAAFVASKANSCPGITKPFERERGVVLIATGKLEKALLAAAVNQVKVKVRVKDDSLELERVWVPAP